MKAKKHPEPATNPTFEQAFERLAEVVSKLEAGEGTLTERTGLFEEGVQLSRQCSGHLDAIERKVEILLNPGGSDEEIASFKEAGEVAE